MTSVGWLLLITLSFQIVYCDIKKRTIRNNHCVLSAVICNLLFFNCHDSLQIFIPLLVFFIGIFLSVKGWLGGGDTKLFAAYSTAILPENLFTAVLMILIVGGVVSLCCLIKNRWTKSIDRGVPYGVAIVIGSLFGIWMSL